jgi:hypothetical protein
VRTLVSAGFAIAAWARAAHAGGGPATDAYDGIGDGTVEVHALADICGEAGGTLALRAFDTTADAPALGWLRVRVARKPRRSARR